MPNEEYKNSMFFGIKYKTGNLQNLMPASNKEEWIYSYGKGWARTSSYWSKQQKLLHSKRNMNRLADPVGCSQSPLIKLFYLSKQKSTRENTRYTNSATDKIQWPSQNTVSGDKEN